jgi:hypothetical protein
MADRFTDIATEGYGSRLGGSITGMLFGIVLLPISVILLYWNEGRAVDAMMALDQGARQVVEVRADRVDDGADGKLVHLSGAMATDRAARDPVFGVTAPGLIRLARHVQMYQWKEDKHTESHESVGGTKITETTYTYTLEWSGGRIDSREFRHPDGHQNPEMPVGGETFDAGEVRIGAYRLGGDVLGQLSEFDALTPDQAIEPPAGYRRENGGFYRGANPSSPTVGDLKVSFEAVPSETASVVAALASGTLTTFHGAKGYKIVMAERGVVSADQLFAEKKHEESTLTWILRGIGFVVMFIGFLLVASPVSTLLAFLPFLEGIAETGAFLIALTLSVPLTLLVVAFAWMAHRPILAGGLAVGSIAAFWLIRRLHRRPAPRIPAGAPPKPGTIFMPPGMS